MIETMAVAVAREGFQVGDLIGGLSTIPAEDEAIRRSLRCESKVYQMLELKDK
jgi:hypothetical protein